MLDSLRASKGGIITWIFLGAIIVVFVISFGPGSFARGGGGCGGAPAYAARVNGEPISARSFGEQVQQMSAFYAQVGQDVNSGPVAFAIRKQAMEAVVQEALVLQEARRRGLTVTDADVSDDIRRQLPSLSEGGKFDLVQYKEWATQNFGSPAAFEEDVRDRLLRSRMVAAVAETVKVSDAEVRDAWKVTADKVNVTFVRFPLAAAEREVKVSDADVKAFADQQRARVDQFYKEHPERFDQKRKARVRDILVRVAPGAPADADAAAKGKVEAALARVKKGEDFGKVASEVSDDEATKGRGGELGFVSEGVADPELAKAVLSLGAGQLSAPFRTASGWNVAQVEEVVPAKQVPLEAARPEIARELLVKERAEKLARTRAQAALDAARKGKSLAEQFPPAKGGADAVAADETGDFTAATGFVPKVGAAPELMKAALAANGGDVLPQVYDTPGGPVVAVVKSRQRADEHAYAAERGRVEAALRREKEGEVFSGWLRELRSRARIEENAALLGTPGTQAEAQE